MRYGVISDIHGNDEALRAALGYLDRAGVDDVVCLGDIVGYNAAPNQCVRLLAERGIRSIAGNHEGMALGRLDTSRCADKVAYAIRQTRKDLAPGVAALLEQLPRRLVVEGGFLLVHGSWDDPTERLDAAGVGRLDRMVQAEHPELALCFFGHTHQPGVFAVGPDLVESWPGFDLQLEPGRRYYVNPGSIDAQRKPEPAAAECAIYDTLRRSLRFAAVPYDWRRVENRALVGGYRITPAASMVYASRRVLRGYQRAALRRLRALMSARVTMSG